MEHQPLPGVPMVGRSMKLFMSCALIPVPALLAQRTFHGDNARTGVYPAAASPARGEMKWKFSTGGAVIASPAIGDGFVYIGSTDGALYAIDEQTGAQHWKYSVSEPISSSPALANGMLYFVTSDAGLYAVRADSGKGKWRFLTQGERRFEAKGLHGLAPSGETIADPMDLWMSSPAVANNIVYFGSSDGHVYALDAATGALQWSYATGDVVHASPTIAGNTVFIGSWDGVFYALDATTGQLKWRYQAGVDPVTHNQVGFQSSAAVMNGAVYVGCRDGHVYAFDAATGQRLWDYSTSQSWVNSTPAVRDGLVYAATSDTHRFFALDARSGRLRFTVDTRHLVFGSPALSGDRIYVGVMNGRLLALDRQSGAIAWTFLTDGAREDPLKIYDADGRRTPLTAKPIFHNFMDMTYHLAQMFTAGAIISSPVVADGVVIFGSTDGNVYAVQ